MVFDKNVVEIGLIAAISLFRTSVDHVIHIHVVCNKLQQQIRNSMNDVLECEKGCHSFEFHYVDTDELCPDLPEASHLTRATYIRLFFPQLFPELERIMYLDTDVLVLEDITGDAVQDFKQDIAVVPDTGGKELNAGVMILDLEKIRQSGLFQKALDWVRSHRENIRFCDQDALRAVVKKNFHVLPQSLNVMRIKSSEHKPKILHYAGKGLKPNTWK
jgi:lipopolysaccharide biosynthesis glycosyltransferase